jgi:hypothetical protein
MQQMHSNNGCAEPAPESVRDAIAVLVRVHGDTTIAQRLGIARQTLARLLAGTPVRRGTVAQCRAGFAERCGDLIDAALTPRWKLRRARRTRRVG